MRNAHTRAKRAGPFNATAMIFDALHHKRPRFDADRRAFIATAGVLCATASAAQVASPAQGVSTTEGGSAAGIAADLRRGLDFPGSAGVKRTMRFRFTNPLAIYPATYIWWAFPRRQAGYYTAFFWGNDDGRGDLKTFLWTPSGDADSYYGAHPYPHPRPHGTNHRWEISVMQVDIVNGLVEYDRWHLQALRVWADADGKHHEFYWDLPRTSPNHRVYYRTPPDWGNARPPSPALTWGDAPWAPGKEVWHGMLRGMQVYESCLPVADILREEAMPRSTPEGARSLWYLNRDPTPDDIADRSGRGHHPQWVGLERPRVWVPQGNEARRR
jgi:hypothetical protein